MQTGERGDEIKTRHPIIQLLRFTDVSESVIGSGILERIRSEQPNLSLTWAQATNDDFQKGRFASTIHSKNAGHTTTDGQTDIIQSDDLSIPLGNVINHDGGSFWHLLPFLLSLAFAHLIQIRHHSRVTSNEFTRLIRIYSETPFISSKATKDQAAGKS